MKRSRFIAYAERKLDRRLSEKEREAVLAARDWKREGVKAVRGPLETLPNHSL